MKKYGIAHFSISLVEETSTPNEREQYWIEQYGSYHKGYNATIGGEGRMKDFTIDEIEQIVALYNKKTSMNAHNLGPVPPFPEIMNLSPSLH